MKSCWMAGLGLAICLGVAAWATAPQDSQDIKSLEDAAGAIHALTLKVATLEMRVSTLESQSGGSTNEAAVASAASPSATAPAGSPVMRIDSVEAVTPDDAAKNRAQALLQEADMLEQKASAQETSAKSITIDSRSQVANDGTRQSAVRQMNALREEAGEARRQARKKRDEAKDLTAPRQIIRGWSGKRSIEAYTERDLSSQLSKLPPGSFITGRWTLVDMDENQATVRVSSISPVAKPANFVDRPAGSGH